MKARIKDTVLDILKNADVDVMTLSQVVKIASEKLDMDLSEPAVKMFVRQVVELYMRELEDEGDEQEKAAEKEFVELDEEEVLEPYMSELEDEADEQEADVKAKAKAEAEAEVVELAEEEVTSRKRCEREYDGLICRLSKCRRVMVHEFNACTLVSIREYYCKGDKEFPTAKGISLTLEQWATLKKNIPAIDEAIMEMKSM